MALTSNTRATMRVQREATARASGLIKYVVVRIESATRLMKSNLLIIRSECYGEYVPGPCTRPSHHGEWVAKEVGSLTFEGLPLCDS